jgi:hypothetical protein
MMIYEFRARRHNAAEPLRIKHPRGDKQVKCARRGGRPGDGTHCARVRSKKRGFFGSFYGNDGEICLQLTFDNRQMGKNL